MVGKQLDTLSGGREGALEFESDGGGRGRSVGTGFEGESVSVGVVEVDML